MPLYLDLHKIQNKAKEGSGLKPEAAFLQEGDRCRCLSSWVDLEKNLVVSLLDAPGETILQTNNNKNSQDEDHEIIRVNSKVAEAFLKRIPENGTPGDRKNTRLRILKKEDLHRVQLVITAKDHYLLSYHMTNNAYRSFKRDLETNLHACLSKFQGNQVLKRESICVITFLSVFDAFGMALKVRNRLSAVVKAAGLKFLLLCENTSEGTTAFSELQFHKEANSKILLTPRVRELFPDMGSKLEKNAILFYSLQEAEERLLKILLQVLNQNWQDPGFNCREFRKRISMSKASLYRKCTALTGRSPNALIREYRLLQALRLLRSGHSISRTCYDTGFNSPSYFSSCFHRFFKLQPGCYRDLCVA